MPLRLIPPAKTPGKKNYAIHGSHLGVSVRVSAKTDRRTFAAAELKRIEGEIERGRYAPPETPVPTGFADAAYVYLKTCPQSEVKRVQRLLTQFQSDPLSSFTPDKIDAGEEALYPGRTAKFKGSTLNREYRTPLAAVLHDAARRELMPWREVPKYTEPQRTRWIEPEQALALIAAAEAGDARKSALNKKRKEEFYQGRLAPLLIFMLTTGARISESVGIIWRDVDMKRREVRLEDTKNDESYTVHLGDLAFEAIANLPGPRHPDRQIFGYTKRWGPRTALETACKKSGLVECDKDGNITRYLFSPHKARHSFATWLRRQHGMDLKKLMELGRWKNVQSVMRYAHVSADEHAPAIAALPINRPTPRKKGAHYT